MIFPKFHKEKFLFIRNIFFVSKTYKFKIFKENIQNSLFLVVFCDVKDKSSFISSKAFLPSFKVVVSSQEREEIIKMVSVISEKKVVSMLLFKLVKYFLGL